MYTPVRIIIADDHEIFKNGFKLLLKDQSGVELVGEAENGRQLIDVVKATLPHVVITDIKMPEMDGIEACRIIKQTYPYIGVIALSSFNDESLIVDMLEAGARGYLLKNTNKHDLMQAIQTVHAGNAYYCAATSGKLTRLIAESKFNPYRSKTRADFTDRELEVMRLICRQYTTKEIADLLSISIRTVESFREKIQEKAGVKNAVGIALYAVKKQIFRVEDITF